MFKKFDSEIIKLIPHYFPQINFLGYISYGK